jgi:two-component system sensor histidine kinase SenX3
VIGAVVIGLVVAAGAGALLGLTVGRQQARREAADLLAETTARQARGRAALEAETTRWREAIDAMPQGVAIFDERGEAVHRNAEAAKFLSGRRADLLVGQAIDELLVAALAGTATTRTIDLFGPPRRTLDVSALPLGDAQHAGAVVVVDDVSERARVDAVRRDFVANISHELKTPVGALALLAETLLDEDDSVVQRRLGSRMLLEAERVGRTIDDLLELSRIEAGELPARDPVPVHLVLAEAVDRVRPAADQAGVAIELREPAHSLLVSGDRRQLTSAVYNLLDNGVKYSDKGSVVVVAGTLDEDAGVAELSVQDQGIGIPARDLERIFERFYRVDRARSRETGGTGLGLAIVRHVAANHDGEVTVSSHEGDGSTFTLRLPVLDPARTDDQTGPPMEERP